MQDDQQVTKDGNPLEHLKEIQKEEFQPARIVPCRTQGLHRLYQAMLQTVVMDVGEGDLKQQ